MSISQDGSGVPIASPSARPSPKTGTARSAGRTTLNLAAAEALSDLDTLCRFAYKHALFARTRRHTGPAVGAQVAQLVEQRIENPRVGSSILSLGTTNLAISPIAWPRRQ